ncbi:alginate lyase family protein [Bradyrhizobium jicamae]|uniref:heparinase II/III family protein n=1 Tax=Bradyrhizobium jicamae TaxID=280332 RepID=UPI001BA763C7|nr:alginate lyase family protein [Bradyrhizobium jicamae]MBR0935655.1 alginate lyase family protein [Bradyrhizobium jicamae]
MDSALGRLVWYRNRLAAMSAAEIVHRVVETATKQTARRHSGGWEAVEPVGPLAIIPGIRSRIAASSPDLSALTGLEADNIRAGDFCFLGVRWPAPSSMPPDPTFWRIDPEDGEPFPQWDTYAFDISFRHGIDTREIKRVWELNRLQFLVPLAADGALRNQDQPALLARMVRSWMEGNPPYRGPSWISGIELALRTISVALALSILGVDCLDSVTHGALLRFFFAHVDWIRRFPSLNSSANNHRIAELAGMIVGTIMAPGFPGAVALRENSWRALLAEIDRQICPDGVGAEQSPGYTAFSIELFLVAAAALGREGSLPAPTVDRLSAWSEHSLWLMDTGGKVPAIGDFDDCRVIATTQTPESRYVASIVAAVSGCVGRPDLAPPAKDPGIRDVILGSAQVSSAQPVGMRLFASGGYSVFRSGHKDPVVLTLDHGPVGYLSIAAHGHADTLSVWLSVGNQPVLADAGTYLYHSSRNLRDLFRDTAVHNTLSLNSVGSSRPSGPFNWASKANARLVSSESAPIARVVAEHDGYVAQHGTRHRRAVEFDDASRFTIVDELLDGPVDKSVTVSFLLDPSCQSTVAQDRREVLITHGGRQLIQIASAGPLKARVVRGDEATGLGWLSPSFGARIPTDQILFEGHLDKPSTITISVLQNG